MEGDTSTPVNQKYFQSYEDFEVHELMLRDTPRNEAYKTAILNNAGYLKDKIVLDVGAGTGLLSIFCAQAGAAKVYAVEANKFADIAKEIVKENNFENVIEVINSRVEDVVLPGDIKVDVIVSEWMGFYLLHEGMLDSVLIARDKFLKEDGLMFPQTATIYVAPCSLPNSFEFWTNVSGVSMKYFGDLYRNQKLIKWDSRVVERNSILAEKEAVCWLNLQEITSAELQEFNLTYVAASTKAGKYQGVAVWFECQFPDTTDANEGVILSTSPSEPPTHWKQTVVVLPYDVEVELGAPIAFKMSLKRSSESDRLYLFEFEMADADEVEHPIPCNCYLTKCIVTKAYLETHPQKEDDDEFEECSTNLE